MKKFEAGFIGAGNMGGALATAAAKQVTGERVAVACSSPAHSAAAAERLGCRAAAPEEILGGSKFVFLGVKPQMIDGVVQSLAAPIAASESIFVSMLAGVQLERLERLLGADKKIIRILPNTACAVGQGVVLYCANGNVTEGDLAAFCALMAAAGIVDPISEALIDAGCAITGCGPAFAYMFIEALADGGVKCGLPRAKAIRYAAQMLAGSAEMVLQSGKHPEQLKDEVCSPGGSTIAGVDALEQHGFRGSCIAAVDAAFEEYALTYEASLYCIGSVVGPHPYPTIVRDFQSVVGREARTQFKKLKNELPDAVVACVGGGSNAIGIFSGFLADSAVRLYGVEPLGRGPAAGDNAASVTFGKTSVMHGFKSLVLEDETGAPVEAYSVASGLDYPSVGPEHAYLRKIGRVNYVTATDKEALDAFRLLSVKEGIIPALESAHAVAYALKLARELGKGKSIVVNLSGRGDKDVNFVLGRDRTE